MRTLKLFGLAVPLSAVVSPLLAEETRRLDAHVHGVTEVQIATEGDKVEIRLHAPGADIVGFEHEATSKKDKAAVAAAIGRLSDAGSVLVLDPAAECTVEDAEAALRGEGQTPGDDHGHEDEEVDGAHSGFEAHYRFECVAQGSLTTVDFPFFETFLNAKEIKVEYVTAVGAGIAVVTRGSSKLTLDGA